LLPQVAVPISSLSQLLCQHTDSLCGWLES
jgi:hypothetical protein